MSRVLLAILVLSSAADLGVLLGTLWLGGRRREVGLARLARALWLASLSAALKAAALQGIAGSLFYAIHLAYVDLVVVTPLAALAALLGARARPLSRAVRRLALLALALLPALGVYATFVEPFRLVEERVNVELPARFAPSEPLRVAVLADLQSRHVDEHLRESVRRALAFEPHLILIPGDLIQNEEHYDEVVPEFRELLRPLAAPLGVYFVRGNTDAPRVVDAFEGTSVRLLEDESVTVDFAGRRVVIGGAGMQRGAPSTQSFLRDFDAREGDELRILVAHYPDVALGLDGRPDVDLVVAGHTHGGQVRLPLLGAPLTLSDVPRAVGSGGLHELGGRRIYVSRGVGCERGTAPRIRFLCPPEVSLLTLVARGPVPGE